MKITAGTPTLVLATTLWSAANGATPANGAAAHAPNHTPAAQAHAQTRATVQAIERAQGPWQLEPEAHDETTVALMDAIRAMRAKDPNKEEIQSAPAQRLPGWEGIAQAHREAASIAYLAAAAIGNEQTRPNATHSAPDTETATQPGHEGEEDKSGWQSFIERSLQAWKNEGAGGDAQPEGATPEDPSHAATPTQIGMGEDIAGGWYNEGTQDAATEPAGGAEESATTGNDLTTHAQAVPWAQWGRFALYAYGACAMIIMSVAAIRAVRRRMRWRKTKTTKRLEQVAAPLRSTARDETASGGERRIFKTRKRKGILGILWEPISRKHPMITPRPTMIACSVGAGAGCATVICAMWVLKIDLGWWNTTIWATGAAIGAWNGLKWMQRRSEAAFVRQFPEVVDQIVRLAGAGVPATEALSVIAKDIKEPTHSILKEVADGMNAGLDTDEALRITTERVKMTEFSMFAAVLRLQKQAGGSLSQAFDNLAKRLRDRRRSALKQRNATSQTRLTIVVLAIMPLAVLLAQKVMSPEQVDKLLTTDTGTLLLRWGIALIATGIFLARGLANRAARAR